MDTMNLWITETPADLREVLARVDLLFINDEESRQLTGERQVANAGSAIIAMGAVGTFVIKRGGVRRDPLLGRLVSFLSGDAGLPARYCRPRRPTGAGDSFAGGFMGFVLGRSADRPRNARVGP